MIRGIINRLASPYSAPLHTRRSTDYIGRTICMRFCVLAVLLSLFSSSGLRAGAREQAPDAVKSVVRADPRTGRLVRRVTASATAVPPIPVRSIAVETRAMMPPPVTAAVPLPAAAAAPVAQVIEEIAKQQGIDPLLVHAVVQVESGYNRFAISPKGAEGLMQLIPSTARQMGVRNSFDSRQNIEGGVKYLRQLMGRFEDLRHVLAAYNAGPEAVAKYRGIPPYTETQDYVYKVGKRYGELRRAQPNVVEQAAASLNPAAASEPQYRPLEFFVDEEGRLHLRTR
jgi:soluble lytic murein transglycosylase-like protein